MLLSAMHRVANADCLSPLDPKAALYRYWMTGRTSNQSGRPRSKGDPLQLTGERPGPATTS